MASLLSVNAGTARKVPFGQLKRSAIDKRPLAGPVAVGRLGLVADEQVDRRHHGGVDQAVYAYAGEDLEAWAVELGKPLPPGCFGENLTTSGLNVTGAVIGERWRVGSVLLEVSGPRIPCSVFQGFVGERGWIERFNQRGRPGAYLRVLQEGSLAAGDGLAIEHRPAHGVTLAEVFKARTGARELAPRLLEAPELGATLRDWALRVMG